jgi:hypothetical protein
MSKDSTNKKLLLGSALAGLMVTAPGLAVTAGASGKFFQTAQYKLGYRLAQAAEASTDTANQGTTNHDDQKAVQGSDSPTAGSTTTGTGTTGEKKDIEKTCGGDKKSGEGKCGAGACG